MTKVNVAVLGASGLVGQRFVEALYDHPSFQVAALTASERRAGERFGDVPWRLHSHLPEEASRLRLLPTNAAALKDAGVHIAFSALPTSIAATLEPQLRDGGIDLFTNAAPGRLEADVPLVVPEVNGEHLALIQAQDKGRGKLIANANCTTTGLVLAIAPLVPFGIRRVVLTSQQALSGAGHSGVSALDISGNVLPHIGNEEEKVVAETAKILGALHGPRIVPATFPLQATCTRVNVPDGHLLSVWVDTELHPTVAEVESVLAAFRGPPQELDLPSAPQQPVVVLLEQDRPQPAKDVLLGGNGRRAGMAVSVGRIRISDGSIGLVSLSHNTIRGAAGGSVLNAELARAWGLPPFGSGVLP